MDRLTPRELDVLALMAEGRSNAAIAARLGLSIKTLEAHIRRILQRLDLEESPDDHRRVLAVLRYLRSDAGLARSDVLLGSGRQGRDAGVSAHSLVRWRCFKSLEATMAHQSMTLLRVRQVE